jgi:peptidoglycan/xylan/chitin deacetylase (PgdA/CDA1 family)
MTAVLATILGLAALLLVVWRVCFGPPPDDVPRVLCFHKLSRRFLLEGTWTTPERFAAIVDRLRARGYVFVDEARYLELLAARPAGAWRHVLLTFDDGYAESIDLAQRVLAPRGIPFLVFMVSDYAGRENAWELSLGRPPARHLAWERVRELAAAGVAFGSHTASHADLTRLDGAAIADDLARSSRAIEAATGRPVRTFSYPFGRYDARARDAVRAAGFEAAFSLYPRGRNTRVDRHALRRDAVYVIDPAWLVERKLRMNGLYGLEEMKCRAINATAVLVPLLMSRRRGGP